MFDINKPEFSKNSLDICRGTILRANQNISYLGVKIGDLLPIGFDGQYVRCQGLTWGIEDLVEEIRSGVWTITGRRVNLSNEVVARRFGNTIEQRKELAH